MATQALYDAIRANDHDTIRAIKESHPGSKWNDVHELRCTCWCIREFGEAHCTHENLCSSSRLQVALVDALTHPNVTIETCRLLFDLGITGPDSCAFLLHLANGVDNYTHEAAKAFLFTCAEFDGRARRIELVPPVTLNAARNFLTMCEWYDPRALAQLRWPCSFKRSKLENETIISVALRSDIVTLHQSLRAPFIKWLNELLAANCPLPRDSDGFCYDKWLLAVRSLYVDEATKTVRDDMPELQTDERLFRRWLRRHIFYGQRAEIRITKSDSDSEEEEPDQCAEVKNAEDGETEPELCIEFENAEDRFSITDSEFDSVDEERDELFKEYADPYIHDKTDDEDSLWWKTWTPRALSP